MMEKKGSVGIIAFSMWYMALGCWGMFLIVINLVNTGKIYESPNLFMTIRNPIVAVILPLSYLIAGIGMLLVKNWARILFIISSIVALANLLFLYFTMFIPYGSHVFYGFKRYIYILIFTIVYILPHLFAIIYVTRPKVKEMFR